jgi:U3 small nucleolar RNA-associated protein 20
VKERFDDTSYESQLLTAMVQFSSLAEQHNRDLVPFFITFAGPNATSKISRHKLGSWLTLFAKFVNPKAMHSTDTLHRLYVSLLSHPDRSTQTLSLSCLLTYKSPHLTAHKDQLQMLLDDTRWRDELTSIDLAKIESNGRKEFVDVLIRLLFGLMLEKKARSRGADRRAAVLSSLAACTDQELALLVELMLQSDGPGGQVGPLSEMSEKQQVGFLTLLGDVLKNLGPRLLSYWPTLLDATIELVAKAQSRISSVKDAISVLEVEDDTEEVVEGDSKEEKGGSLKATRAIRQLGMKRFADFFRCPVSFNFTPYMQKAFETFISPRLPTLDMENTQAPSTLLELFYTWTLQEEHAMFFVLFDGRVLPKIYDCLIAANVKPVVISRVFDIVDHLLTRSAGNAGISETVVKPHVSLLLENLSLLVERTKDVTAISAPLSQRQISILSQIAQYSTDSSQASTLLTLFSPLLRKPHKLVAEKIKVDLLKILTDLLPLVPNLSDPATTVNTKTYEMLSQLFQSLRSRPARLGLVSTFRRFATIDSSVQAIADLLDSLNAFSVKRFDEPDYDRRLEAFTSLNESLHTSLSARHWLPLLYNMLHCIQDPTELAIRNNASFTLRNFVDIVSSAGSPDYEIVFLRTLYPGLKNGLRSRNEQVRAEVLGVIAYAVAKCDRIRSLQDMRILLADGDEEANFFNNIHHIQIHRRTRALRRLADQCDEGHVSSNALAEIFVPLISNYVASPVTLDHHLVNEAVLTTGRIAKHLAWGAYYALVQRYLRASKNKDESERVYIRAVVAVLQNFHFPMEEVIQDADILDDDNDLETVNGNVLPQKPNHSSSKNLGRIADVVSLHLLPSLLQHLEKRDDTDDSIRIPISIGIVEVAKHLPSATRDSQICRLLTVLSQVLRSKSQETRDLTRDTLCRIAISLGPSYLPNMLREMRDALLRGPQLHVLAYVTHALLVHVTAVEHVHMFHTLDGCVHDIAHVSAEVIFGQSGKDVQAEEFKTKMREVRASAPKAQDSFAVTAKFVTPPRISGLLGPLRAIMQETESIKVMQQVEEVLRRIASGLNANKHLVPTELLVLCHTLISQNSRFLKDGPTRIERQKKMKTDAIVQMKRQQISEANHYTNNSFR